MGLIWVFGGVLVFRGVLWGVSIIKRWENSKANPLKKHKKNLTRELEKSILHLGGVKNFMKKIRKMFLLGVAILSLSGCGGSRELTFSSGELTFKEVEDKMEYVLMSEDVKIEFYSIDKYGKFYYGLDEDPHPDVYFKTRFDGNGKFVNYVIITSHEYFDAKVGDNAYGEQQE